MRIGTTSYRIGIAGLISLALHLSIAAGILLLGRAPVPPPDGPDKPVAVELVMEEHQGAGKTDVRPPPAEQTPPQPRPPESNPTKPTPPPPERTAPSVGEGPAPPPPQAEPAPAQPPPPPPRPQPAAATPPAPTPPAARPPVPQISLGGTDSESNALVQPGDAVIPATPDKTARNRPPVYPKEAARSGQQGSVLLAIHVGPSGLPSGVEVERSSGYPLLDKSAEEAVMKWTFVPAVKDGLPVPYDFRMNFTFAFE